MTIIEALGRILFYAALDDSGFEPTMKDYANAIEKDLKVLEILKPRIKLEDNTLKNFYFTVEENGLPKIEGDEKEVEVAFIDASGFVFRDSEEYKLLKEWLNEQ